MVRPCEKNGLEPGNTLSAQLLGRTLDTGREENYLAGKLAQGHDGSFSTLGGDIANKNANP